MARYSICTKIGNYIDYRDAARSLKSAKHIAVSLAAAWSTEPAYSALLVYDTENMEKLVFKFEISPKFRAEVAEARKSNDYTGGFHVSTERLVGKYL